MTTKNKKMKGSEISEAFSSKFSIKFFFFLNNKNGKKNVKLFEKYVFFFFSFLRNGRRTELQELESFQSKN